MLEHPVKTRADKTVLMISRKFRKLDRMPTGCDFLRRLALGRASSRTTSRLMAPIQEACLTRLRTTYRTNETMVIVVGGKKKPLSMERLLSIWAKKTGPFPRPSLGTTNSLWSHLEFAHSLQGDETRFCKVRNRQCSHENDP